MENRASAIIISKRHILLIHRIRAQREYYVFPGGHIEDGEVGEKLGFPYPESIEQRMRVYLEK